MAMRVDESQIKQLSLEETKNNYLVKNFFPQYYEEIKVYEMGNRDLQEENHINFPRNSWNKIVLPFSKNEKMRNKISRFYTEKIRIGVLMEMLDYQAVISSYEHVYRKRDLATIVTASVDDINFYKKLQTDRDLIIISYPNYVGKTSLEICIDMLQPDDNGKEELRATASFLMVARQKKDHSKGYKVPQMSFQGEHDIERCKMRFAVGNKKNQKRKEKFTNSLEIKPPNSEEINYVHSFYLNKKSQDEKYSQNIKNISETSLKKNLLMHMQDRNLHGKIFGGFLMREAFEIGWLCAYQHTQGKYPEIYHIDDFQFISAVTVGDVIEFEARVTYVYNNLMHVYIEVKKRDFKGKFTTTNDLHLTFVIADQNNPDQINQQLNEKQLLEEATPIPQVIPVTYEEAMIQCDARRRIKDFI
ncbi:hypothetical protein PPERSA_08748 [Pseudocohnilembus persalinus]|uniref:HotDog ACOT-type domain-containing protein n=1 Tax=Pseudocohnilembus persalinus TaxID=266149 RepID=A0A0V0R7H5_PSEPJ|nr:hypothetical protein PPERSA_08748 [Pseudocohnilembus persalinus]|eukprot:KRX10446.1 hypothetical protein PPERSA_08748 [Pseudocohnilembus persalinus]